MIVYVNKDDLYIVDYQYTWWTILVFGYCRNADRSLAFSVRKSARTGVTSLVETPQWRVWFRQYLLS